MHVLATAIPVAEKRRERPNIVDAFRQIPPALIADQPADLTLEGHG